MTGRRAVRATVDDGRCVRSGTCVSVARGLFALGAGHAEFVPGESDDDALVIEAAECCPTEAIAVHDAATGEQIFPAVPVALDPQAAALLAQLQAAGVRDFPDLGVAGARGMLTMFPSMQGEPVPMAEVVDRAIPGPDGCPDIPVRIYRPGPEPSATLLYFHGGGFVLGDLEVADRPCRRLAAATGCVVISVDYRLAPEHPAPAAVEDAYAALCWACGDGPLIVGGDSAGGNLAAVVCLLARDRGGPRIDLQLLMYPITDLSQELPSRERNGEGYLLTARGMRWFGEQYLRDGHSPLDPSISPLQAPDLTGLPPAIVVTAEFDPLRDEGEAYARRLLEAGNEVHLERNPGMIHGFLWMSGVLDRAGEVYDSIGERVRATLLTSK